MAHAGIDELVRALSRAESVVVLTGAGISAESGIPTFRDPMTGLWSRFRPEDLATPAAFSRDPALVTRWYDARRQLIAGARPNAGHLALARLEQTLTRADRRFLLLTQNIDRLHHAAGSREVVELHGTLWIWRCVSCGAERQERGPEFVEVPLRCTCGGLRRPGVVWFGECLPEDALARAFEALESCEVFLAVGTSALVEPSASFGRIAKGQGAVTAEVDPNPTAQSGAVDHSIRGKAGEVLPELVARLSIAG